jgi:CBS domain-containing protein
MRHPKTKAAARRHEAPSRPAPGALTVQDIMSTEVVVLEPELTLRDAVTLLSTRQITGAPVVSVGKIVGTLSANDVLAFEADTPGVPTERREEPEPDGEMVEAESEEDEWAKDVDPPSAYFSEQWGGAEADVAERLEELSGPEWDVLQEHTVAEAMSQGLRWVSPATSIEEAAAYMLRGRIHRAVVLHRGELVGIVTATDVMRAVAERRT